MLDADINLDGAVDAADYVILRRYFDLQAQSSAASGLLSLSLPEPSGFLLVLAGAAAAAPWERRCRQLQH
jgi:hypothetical protein